MDEHDYHLVGLYDELLFHYLKQVGLASLRRVVDFGFFQDSSSMQVHGVPISLNVTATKAPA